MQRGDRKTQTLRALHIRLAKQRPRSNCIWPRCWKVVRPNLRTKRRSWDRHICELNSKAIVSKIDTKGFFTEVFRDVDDLSELRNKKIKKKKAKKDDR